MPNGISKTHLNGMKQMKFTTVEVIYLATIES